MNTDQLSGNWKQIRGKVQEQWGRLTNDDLDTIAGKREQLVGKVQTAYGKSRQAAEEEVSQFFDRLS